MELAVLLALDILDRDIDKCGSFWGGNGTEKCMLETTQNYTFFIWRDYEKSNPMFTLYGKNCTCYFFLSKSLNCFVKSSTINNANK